MSYTPAMGSVPDKSLMCLTSLEYSISSVSLTNPDHYSIFTSISASIEAKRVVSGHAVKKNQTSHWFQ
jgi:hypothetical protein